ncbi:uncharacterized protein LOC62_04G005281 [Vanrija pseudolonga]|uniref:Uncharacterized protein n=1 Tax=Vanrija pseudolonga TaxID=143232 RepID=A0AAF0Y809_9TREE|nr:hypothetical protein LOC62_04G005281 [Vanrija pseudolonga]
MISTVTIDHSTHPDIIECILSHAPVGALIRLRATSRAYHERISPSLLAHVVLVRHPDRHACGFAVPPEAAHDGGHRLPYALQFVRRLRILHPSLSPETIHAVAPSLDTLVRVGTIGPLRKMDLVNNALEHVHTTVDHIDAGLIFERWRDTLFLPANTRRFVVHIAWNVGRWDELAKELSIVPKYTTGPDGRELSIVREIVVVLWPRGMPTDEQPTYNPAIIPMSHRENTGPSRLMPVFWLLNRGLGKAILSGASVTVVGLERCPPCQIGGDENTRTQLPSKDVCFCTFAQGIEAEWAECGVAPARAAACMRNLRMVTLEDWQAELGDRRDIEGEWRGLPEEWCIKHWARHVEGGKCWRCREEAVEVKRCHDEEVKRKRAEMSVGS